MSFVEQKDIFAAVEPVIRGVFEEFSDSPIASASLGQVYKAKTKK